MKQNNDKNTNNHDERLAQLSDQSTQSPYKNLPWIIVLTIGSVAFCSFQAFLFATNSFFFCIIFSIPALIGTIFDATFCAISCMHHKNKPAYLLTAICILSAISVLVLFIVAAALYY